jgi:hypothetical protein
MNEHDLGLFEADLQRLRPAKPSEEFLERLARTAASKPADPQVRPSNEGLRDRARMLESRPRQGFFFRIGAPWRLPGWLAATAAAAAAVAFGLLTWQAVGPTKALVTHRLGRPAQRVLRADQVEIGQDLVATFDAVALLPSGQPVRFRCQEWSDQTLLRDTARGVVIEQRTPRLEVVPVCFETY